jgi:tetratricopeptide (TPR) repeat protein
MFEEWRTGPAPGIVVTPDMLAAMHDDQLLPIADLDAGFIRPKYPNQVQVSYVQAGLICTFIESHWGFDRLLAFLKEFTRETTTARAVEATFKMPPTEFDKLFQDYLQKQYGPAAARIQEWKSFNIAAHKAAEAKKWPEALSAARTANEIYPQYSGSGSPYLIAAKALEATQQRDDAIRTLLVYRRFGGWDPGALTILAQWLREAHRDAEALTILEALNYVDPLDADHHTLLGESLLTANRPQDALTEFQTLLALDTHDPATAKFGLARALHATGESAASKRVLLEALEIAPHYKPAQALLLETIEEPHP